MNLKNTPTSPLKILKEQLFAFSKVNSEIFAFICNQGNSGLLFFELKNPKNKYISDACTKSLGYDSMSLSEKESLNIMAPEDEKTFIASIEKKTKESTTCNGVQLLFHKKGHKTVMNYEGFICTNDKNGSTYLLCKLNKKSPSTKQYENIITGAAIATWESNLVTREVLFNENWAAMLGYTYAELYPLTIDQVRSYIHPNDLEKTQKNLTAHIEGKKPFYEFESRMKHKSGKWVWIYLKSKIVTHTPEGKPEWVSGYLEDISLKKQLFDIQNTFIDQAPRAVAMFDTNMVHIAASKKWIVDFALNKKVIGKSLYEIFPQIDDKWSDLHNVCLGGVSESGEEEYFIREDGKPFWVSWDIHPWYTIENTVGGLIIYLDDISKRKLAEENLTISEATFSESFHSSATGMVFVSEDGRCIKANKAFSNIIGYSLEELLKISFKDITHPEDLDIDLKYFEELVNDERTFYHIEKRYIHKKGHILWALLSVAKVEDPQGNILYFIAQITDITEQKNVQLEASKTSFQLQSLIDASTHVTIIATDLKGTITVFNKGAENLLGYKKEEVLFKENNMLFTEPSEGIARGVKPHYGTKDKSNPNFSINIIKKEGHDTREWTFIRKNGEHFPVLLTLTAIRNADGKKIGFLGIANDLTTIKTIERKNKSLLSISREQNEKLKNFAQIVSHNLRSHYGNSEMLLELFQDEHPSLQDDPTFNFIKETSEKLNQTISLLNDVVVINSAPIKKLDTVDVQKIFKKALYNTGTMAKNANVAVENTINNPLLVLGIDAYIESIIQNIISNAIKYSSSERASFLKITYRKEGNFIGLFFEDNGLGLDLKKHGNKIFGMYKTFHKHEDARGIGLFLSRQQVEVMGGRIEVESVVDKGSIFKVYLPYE